jgi:branched-subunit amino acid transport protein
MNSGLVFMALMAGAANWAFRALPTMLLKREPHPEGMAARFLASTGPAAIATLFTASVLPQLYPMPREVLPLVVGTVATVMAFLPRRSVVAGTLAGAAAYAAVVWLLG